MTICGGRAESCCLWPSQTSDLYPLEWLKQRDRSLEDLHEVKGSNSCGSKESI